MKGIKLSFLLIIILSACGKSSLNPKDYMAWFKGGKHGLTQTKEVYPLEVKVHYQPIDALFLKEQIDPKALSKEAYQKRLKDFEGSQYYTLELGLEKNLSQSIVDWGIQNSQQQEQRMKYLSYGMKKHIYLVEDQDTLSCALYHFERSYDLGRSRNFVLAFEQKEERILSDKLFVFDSPVFGTGPIKLKFKSADLQKIPRLTIQ